MNKITSGTDNASKTYGKNIKTAYADNLADELEKSRAAAQHKLNVKAKKVISRVKARTHDNGGWAEPGWNYNGTGAPEMALNNAQGRALERAINNTTHNTGGHTFNVTIDAKSLKELKTATDFVNRLETTARSGRRK